MRRNFWFLKKNSFYEPKTDKHTIEKILPQHDLIYVSSSMQGWRTTMEDVHTVQTNVPEFSNYSFFGVYDGHCGKKTAEYIGTNLHINIFKKIHEIGEKNIEEAIKIAFMQTDSDWKMDEKCDYVPGKISSGSTAVTAVITPSKNAYIGNTGDSRAVMSASGLAIPLSKDHKPLDEDEEKRIYQAGGFVEHGRIYGKLSLSRAFGDFLYKTNDKKKPEEQIITAYPDVNSYKIDTETDFLVLACDGIWDCKTSQGVIDFINEDIKVNKDLSKACENLMNSCLAKSSYDYGSDNMTIIIIGFLHGLEKKQWLERISSRGKKRRIINQKKLKTFFFGHS